MSSASPIFGATTDADPTAIVGPIFSGLADGVPTQTVGPIFQVDADGAPARVVGPVLFAFATGAPAWGASPIFLTETTSFDALVGYRPTRVPVDAARIKEIAENDVLGLRSIQTRILGTQTGLWFDDSVTTIQIGGGASQGLITIGRAGGDTQLVGGLHVITQGAYRRGLGDLTIGPENAIDRLSLRSLGVTKALNAVGSLALSPEFTSASLLGAVNELLERPALATETDYQNTTGGLLELGTAVAVFDTGEIQEADASADDDLSRFLGLLQADTADTALGPVATTGRRTAKFAPGEGTGPHANKLAYLSTTAGYLTLTAPSGSGNVVLPVGYVADDSAYDNGLGGTMEVQLVRASKRVLP